MTIEAEIAKREAVSFEAWKEKIREQDGGLYRISFDVQAADLPQRAILARKGTRFIVVLVELEDNDTPKVSHVEKGRGDELVRPPKPYGQKAKALANLTEFQDWAGVMDAESAVQYIRDACAVPSCADIGKTERSEKMFLTMENTFKNWSQERQRGRG